MTVILEDRFPQIIAQMRPRLDAALAQGAERIEANAKVRAPDRSPFGEGLVDAIHTERLGSLRYAVVAGDDDAFYGHFLEFGTVKAAPRPFLVPAFEESRDDIVRDITVALLTL